jgi:hypothetical protein
MSSGFVFIGWHKDVTIFDYDRNAFNSLLYFEKTCLPVQCISFHICCPTSVILNVLKPIASAFTDKRARARTVIHDVPESKILDILSEYGIMKEMLPTEMGGTIRLNQSEWMANRRAAEMEEL